jgi:hypothetical protein
MSQVGKFRRRNARPQNEGSSFQILSRKDGKHEAFVRWNAGCHSKSPGTKGPDSLPVKPCKFNLFVADPYLRPRASRREQERFLSAPRDRELGPRPSTEKLALLVPHARPGPNWLGLSGFRGWATQQLGLFVQFPSRLSAWRPGPAGAIEPMPLA